MSGSRVLVVEDNEALAENTAELFEGIGAQVRLCHDADAALAEATAEPFELGIVDMRLPGSEDGLALLPQLRQHAPDAEFILVTGNATLNSAVAAVRQGIFAYVLKPFEAEELVGLGERALVQVALRRERERLAQELAQSEALYRSVVETVEGLIVGLTEDGHIHLVNHYVAEMFGYPPEELHGRRLSEYCVQDATRMNELIRTAGAGERVHDREIEMEVKGGRRVVRWTFAPFPDEVRDHLVVLAVGMDVTERLELERQNAENEAMAAMGRLTTALAHEIRNPLNAAKLQLQLLARQAEKFDATDETSRFTQRAHLVQDELERLSRMLEEFLSLARPRAFSHEPFPLASLVDEVVALQQPLAEAGGARFRVDIDPEIVVRGDREKIKQVLINLLGNALDALRGQRGGEVTLEAYRSEPWAQVRVIDNGPGLPLQPSEDLFDPFVTTKEAGTGLGLALVKRIVEVHGGTITLYPGNEEEGGAVASFTLPLSESPESLPAHSS